MRNVVYKYINAAPNLAMRFIFITVIAIFTERGPLVFNTPNFNNFWLGNNLFPLEQFQEAC